MPAIITHHIFGEDIVSELPAGLVEGEEELLAFLLANQGPDPLSARFSTLPSRSSLCRSLGARIQGGRVTRTFMRLRDGVAHLPASEERIGRAFALGLLGHYVLDRTAHPFIVSQQRAIIQTDRSLAPASRGVHAVIESELDSWILWEKRRATVKDRPVTENLMRTDRVSRVGGALFSQIGLAVFGIALGAQEYARSVSDYETFYRAIEPAGSSRLRAMGQAERLVRGWSLAEAYAHYVTNESECPAANLSCRPWRHPFTDETRTESFADLFDEARLSYPALAEAFVRGNESQIRDFVSGLNYEGRPGTDL